VFAGHQQTSLTFFSVACSNSGGDLQSMMSSNEAIVDVEEGHIKGFPVIE
jgi:hypothetical protein